MKETCGPTCQGGPPGHDCSRGYPSYPPSYWEYAERRRAGSPAGLFGPDNLVDAEKRMYRVRRWFFVGWAVFCVTAGYVAGGGLT